VRHDASGRAVWEWAAETGRNALDSTSRLLKRLELPGLSLADDDKEMADAADATDARDEPPDKPPAASPPPVPTFGGARESDPLGPGRGSFNPYDNRAPVKKVAPAASSKAAARPASKAPTLPQKKPADKPGFFSRLFGK
jgi:hypothetical protein